MERNVVLVGDPPTTGGAVLPNDCRSYVNDVAKALVGGKVWCAACKSEGFIAKAGGPYRPTFCGVEGVLDGDLVICQCPAPPTLHALAVSSRPPQVYVDDRVETLEILPPPFRQYVNLRDTEKVCHHLAHSLRFELKNTVTGKLLPNTPYRILLSTNTQYVGISDSSGLTETVENDTPFTAQLEAPYYGNPTQDSFLDSGLQYSTDNCSC